MALTPFQRSVCSLLSDIVAPRPITLEKSIALALAHNTSLRIQKLNPIAATARVRQACAVRPSRLRQRS